jgi:phosphatidylserine synthase
MNWRLYQRIFELAAIFTMMAGIVLLWMRLDPLHYVVYVGFLLLATGKLVEALNVYDPQFRIIKIAACISIYTLVALNLLYSIRSILYILVPLAVYYVLHYRWLLQQKKI